MFIRFLAVMLATGVVVAQTGIRETALPAIGQPLTIGEQFVAQLRLDNKTQVPEVDEILVAAAKEATPVATELLQIRQRLVNAELQNKPDDQRAVLEEYRTAAAKMAAIESAAFTKIYAQLKPNQQQRAAEAFSIMAGIFLPTPPPARRPQQRGGGR